MLRNFLTSRGNVVPIYGTTYSTGKSVVNNISIHEAKTISGDLVSEKKTNNNNKGLTRRFLRVGYMYTSAPSGPDSSLSRLLDVGTATVVRVLL